MDNEPTPSINNGKAKSSSNDLSRRVVSVARAIDRLGEGNYLIVIEKAEFIWRVRIHRTTPIQDLELKT